jgi:hypothetical protein
LLFTAMHPTLRHVLLQRIASVLVVALLGCTDGVPVDVNVGPVSFDVDVARISLPANLQGSGVVARVPCLPGNQCLSLGVGAPVLRCIAGACDPDPVAIDLAAMNAIDLGTYSAQLGVLGDAIRTISVTEMTWQVVATGLRVPVASVEIFWGPETASGISSDGVRRLGRIPTIAGSSSGSVALDMAGNAGLSSHLLRVSRRFRLFTRAAVDLSPGGPLPAGRASIQVRMRVRAETGLTS